MTQIEYVKDEHVSLLSSVFAGSLLAVIDLRPQALTVAMTCA